MTSGRVDCVLVSILAQNAIYVGSLPALGKMFLNFLIPHDTTDIGYGPCSPISQSGSTVKSPSQVGTALVIIFDIIYQNLW